MSKLILVTGGLGYIGSHTAVELMSKGYDVVIVDNLSNSNVKVLDGIEEIAGKRPHFEQFDLTDKERTRDFFKRHNQIQAVIHFAASKAVGESVEKPLHYYHNNLGSLLSVLMGMSECEAQHLVFSSSCTVYGQPDSLPVAEDAPIKKANSPYGNTKQVGEEIIQDAMAADENLKTISLRYFNPIGAHPSALIGELPLGVPDNLVPFITQTAIGLREQLKVFGDDYQTRDGSAIRDYINVMDLANAHVIAIERLLRQQNKKNFEVFNLGTGKGISVLEIIKAFETATGEKLNYSIVGRRPGDVEAVYSDTHLANTELGWQASTPIEDTLLSAWNWEKRIRC